MDGIQLLHKIKAESPTTEIIMITGHGDMELAIQSLKFDATDFITKPINDDVLEIALKRALEKISMRAQLESYTENLEMMVAEKSEQLVKAERLSAVGQTVAGLAHAIKNMTSGLSGGMFVLEKGIELNNPTYLSQGWKMIKGNVGRIKHLALDLLNYTKEREPGYQKCDPNWPIREVYELMISRAKEQDIELVLDLDPTLPHTSLDPEGIHRCLLNLTSNAIDACTDIDCSRRKGKVEMHSRRCDGWAVEYRIIDNGCGMDKDVRVKIFQRFFSTKGSRGTGLGLMITKKIIEEHHGTIEFQTEKNEGSTFIIRLPKRDQGENISS